MAYPAIQGPSGLRPVKLLSGVSFVGLTRHYKIASGYATNIFYGDAVKLVTGGTVEREAADAAMTFIGVFLGCTYTDPNLKYKLFSQYYPANTAATDIEAYVSDTTDVLFKVAIVSSNATIGSMTQSDVGANAALVDNTGDVNTGNSRVAVSESTATTNTLPVRIVSLVEETKNADGEYTEALVKWNDGHQFNSTTGV